MLPEIAVGDSYGSGFEFATGNLPKNTLTTYVKHPRHPLLPGQYTDDTQMSIGIAELVVNDIEFTPINIANKFVEVFQRDHREGYAHRFYQFLCSVTSGQDFLDRIKPDSEKSGAAMRAGPLGVIADTQELLRICEIQARVTHNTDNGVAAAQAAALMPHYFLYSHGPKAELGTWISALVEGPWNIPWTKQKVGVSGVQCVQAAIHAVTQYDNLAEMLKAIIEFTGDVDTVAAIAMAGASCSSEVDQNLPENLYLLLEQGDFGLKFLQDLDLRLLAKVET